MVKTAGRGGDGRGLVPIHPCGNKEMKQRDETSSGHVRSKESFHERRNVSFPVALSTSTVIAPTWPRGVPMKGRVLAGERNKCGSQWSGPGQGDSR